MATKSNPIRADVTIIRGDDGSTTVYDNKTRKPIVEADEGNKSSGGFSRKGKTKEGNIIVVDQTGAVSEEINNKPNQTISRAPNPLRKMGGQLVSQNEYTYRVDNNGGFVTESRPLRAQQEYDRSVSVNEKLNRGEKVFARDLSADKQTVELSPTVATQASVSTVQDQYRRKTYTPEQQREAGLRLQGIRPYASAKEGGEIAQIGQSSFVLTQVPTGSNLKGYQIAEYKPNRLRQYGYSTMNFGIQGVFMAYDASKQYLNFLDKNMYTIERPSRTNPKYSVTEYVTGSRRTDVVAATAIRRIFTTYPQARDIAFKEFKVAGYVQQKALDFSQGTFALGSSASEWLGTRTTKYVPIGYAATRAVVQPFVESAIKDPVMTYASIRGPMVLGKAAYRAFDYADVGQSVATQAFAGYKVGGWGGAAVGGAGGFFGEKLSDKGAFFAQGRPSAPQYRAQMRDNLRVSFIETQPSNINTQEFKVVYQYQGSKEVRQDFMQSPDYDDLLFKRNIALTVPKKRYTKQLSEVEFEVGEYAPQLSVSKRYQTYQKTPSGTGYMRVLNPNQWVNTRKGRLFGGSKAASLRPSASPPFSFSTPQVQVQQPQVVQFGRETTFQRLRVSPMTVRQMAQTRTQTRVATDSNSLLSFGTASAFVSQTRTRTQSQTRTRTQTQTATQSMTRSMTALWTVTTTPTATPTWTFTPTQTPTRTYTRTSKKNLFSFQPFTQSWKSPKRKGRYTQSIGAIFGKAPKGFDRSWARQSGIGVRF